MKRAVTLIKQTVEEPSKAGPNQIFGTEPISNVIGGPRRYRNLNEHPLALAWYKGRITDYQYAAGEVYRKWYEAKMGTLKSCLNINVIAPKFGRYDVSDSQLDADLMLSHVNSYLGRRDKIIVEKLCGEGYSFVEAYKAAGLTGDFRVSERVKESLDELALALKYAMAKKPNLKE